MSLFQRVVFLKQLNSGLLLVTGKYMRQKFRMQVNQAPRYTTFFMLNSVEHEISNAHKYINIKKFGCF